MIYSASMLILNKQDEFPEPDSFEKWLSVLQDRFAEISRSMFAAFPAERSFRRPQRRWNIQAVNRGLMRPARARPPRGRSNRP